MSEHPLVWQARSTGPTSAAGEESLRLLGMPQGFVRTGRQIRAVDTLTDTARRVLTQVLEALRCHAGSRGEPVRISLQALDEHDRGTIADVLGEGDVWVQIGGNADWRIVESVLTGVWRVETTAADGASWEWLELGSIPLAVSQAAERMPADEIQIPKAPPPGAMNALALLAEIRQRSITYTPGRDNHVVNFSLLPLTEVDAQLLTTVLGQIPLIIRSTGYSSVRIYATGLRHVWAVQYLNSMGRVILDTMEIGGVPTAALAAPEDLDDSALRLAEILDTYSA